MIILKFVCVCTWQSVHLYVIQGGSSSDKKVTFVDSGKSSNGGSVGFYYSSVSPSLFFPIF